MYLTATAGYDGILKQRFTDFVVQEITAERQVVRLTDESAPAEPEETKSDEMVEQAMTELNGLIGEELFGRIAEAHTKKEKDIFTVEKELDKVTRTKVHGAVRTAFAGEVDSSTKDGKLIITTGGARARGDYHAGTRGARPGRSGPLHKMNASQDWPLDRPPVLRFTLLKVNKDAGAVLSQLARNSGINERQFRVAGTKDKRGVTMQHVSLKKVLADRIIPAARQTHGCRVGNFEYVAKELKLSSAWGNRFHTALRFVSASDDLLKASVEQIARLGFVNYQGLQRFGTTSAGTHLVGLAILRGEIKNAIDLILAPCCPSWCTDRDPKKAYLELEKSGFRNEKLLLDALRVAKSNYAGAMQRLPALLRSMYLHAYQGYLFNVGASERILRGSKEHAEAGDLIMLEDVISLEDEEGGNDGGNTNGGSTDFSYHAKVKVLTADEAAKYKLSDVVLPIPGPGVTIPANYVGEKILATMKENGFPFEKWPEAAKRHNIQGGYRRLICIPENVSHKIVRYNEVDAPLFLNDQLVLDKRTTLGVVPDGKYKALTLQLDLPSGCYATMFFRELHKRSTGLDYQKEMAKKWDDETGVVDGAKK